VAPKEIETQNMYKGVMPFIAVQIFALFIVGFFPEIATWLPDKLF
jgi:TRAP-type mannitol/chloroaromatic compound transport system permease large subunit